MTGIVVVSYSDNWNVALDEAYEIFKKTNIPVILKWTDARGIKMQWDIDSETDIKTLKL